MVTKIVKKYQSNRHMYYKGSYVNHDFIWDMLTTNQKFVIINMPDKTDTTIEVLSSMLKSSKYDRRILLRAIHKRLEGLL